ncbi:hypothetical protein V6N11_083935 [Hibiscus sabdariffa]|uniref:Uncharacterized protein n=1 Tax=Hibiscus sabdariffa TaxID=183260 RepID=A0ABR2QD02_9ROSI
MVAEETLEPSSFKRGRMLTEMRVLERIEERLELVVEGRSFPIRLSEADTFLCGPRYSCPHDSQASSTNSERMEDHSQGVPVEQEDLVDVVRQFDCDKGNVEVEVEGADSKSGEAIAVEGVVLWLRGGKMTYERVLERFLTRITDSAPSPLSFVEKLRSLKVFLKVWNRESFGSVDLQIETTAEFLNDLEDGGMGDRSLEEFEASRHQLQGNL